MSSCSIICLSFKDDCALFYGIQDNCSKISRILFSKKNKWIEISKFRNLADCGVLLILV